ncbi:hypothetical protein WDZ92_01080 [Nostoc sp. NIES-2111]
MMRFDYDGREEVRNGQQFVSGRAAYGDGYTRIHRIESHGFASSPVKGAKGLILPSSRDPELAFVLGLESPGHRPADLPAGGTAIYDAAGNVMKYVMGAGVTVDVAGNAYVIRKGGVSLTVSADGVAIEGNVTINGNVNVSGSVVDGDGNNGA